MHRDLLTTGEIAKFVGVAPRTAAKWIDTGLLKGYRVPGTLARRVTRADFDAFCHEHELVVEARYPAVALNYSI